MGGYVEGDPHGREDYEVLARRVQAFWLGHLGGSGGEIEEVRFEN